MSKVYRYCDSSNNLQEVTVNMSQTTCAFSREYWIGDSWIREWTKTLTFTLSAPIDVPLQVNYIFEYTYWMDYVMQYTTTINRQVTIPAGLSVHSVTVICRKYVRHNTNDGGELPQMQEIR